MCAHVCACVRVSVCLLSVWLCAASIAGCMPPFSRRRRRSEKKKPVNETPLGVVFDNCKEDESGLHAALVGLAGGKQAAYQSSLKVSFRFLLLPLPCCDLYLG